MIDFWEILGHAVTDDDFRGKLFSTFTASNAMANPDKTNPFACLFSNADYGAARGLVLTKVAPVSLMALGEWLAVSIVHKNNSPTLLGYVATVVKAQLNGYSSQDPVFFRTLGAAIVDNVFRTEFNAGNEGKYGFKLSTPDRNALSLVIGNGGFNSTSQNFHDDSWSDACKDMVIQSGGHPYAHALEVKFP